MILLFVFLLCVTHVIGEDPVIEITNGKIKGEIMSTPYNRSFYAFRGIPFAKPPLGELRFQPPQKVENWTGILDSDAKDRKCIQMSSNIGPNESEDCLYIHVYTPQLPTENETISLPVMYVIHGGGFEFGTPTVEELGPQYLLDYDIVVVSVGYRIGLLGFLSTGDLNCPGNWGLKDQQHGLKWVQENIRYFGGDPKKVTIFGESAGGVSVGLHLLSNNAEGLFIGDIQDSGSSLANWGIQSNPKEIAYELARQLNATMNESNTSTLELLGFFRSLNIDQIKKACSGVFGEDADGVSFYDLFNAFVLSPTIEPEHEGAFLSRSPYQKFLTGDFNKVPTLLGINSEECLFMVNDPSFEETMTNFDQNTELYVPPDMHITDLKTKKLVGEKIAGIFSPSVPMHENRAASVKLFSDGLFGRSMIKQAQMMSKHVDVFFYEFEYSGPLGSRFEAPDVPGAGKVMHCEEMMYMFHREDAKDIFIFPEDDRVTMRRMLTMWTNFVKHQNPTPEKLEILEGTIWPKVQSIQEMPYLSINKSLTVKYDVKKNMMEGFQKLYDDYAVPPLDTY